MNIRIYQVNTDLDEKGVAFAPLDRLERIQGEEEVNAAVYEKVFDGTVSETTLDGVYDLFNEDRPRGFTGRSMSVSDVVQVVDGPVEKGFYYCDSFTFRKIPFREELTSVLEQRRPIRVVLVEAGCLARPEEIGTELEDLQQAVDGLIETYYPFEEEGVCVVCNDEGKILGMEPNRGIFDERGELVDVICGPFFVCGCKGPDFTSLSDEQVEKYTDMFLEPERFFRVNGKIRAVPCDPWREGEAR